MMKTKQWTQWIGSLIGTLVLTNLPFLPGPSMLYMPAQLFYSGGQIFSLLGIILVPIGIIWTIREFGGKEANLKTRLRSVLLWAIPLTVFLSTTYLSNLTRDWSRMLAIQQADKLIEKIESYRNTHGNYPDTLENSGIHKPLPGIIGIPAFGYQKKEEDYQVIFTQNVIMNFNFEVVVYDKTNRHEVSGEMKKLYDTGYEHWKYYIYD